MSLVPLRPDLPLFLSGYLPHEIASKPFVTLTYAQSLDSRISKGHGIRTTISHVETKTMTHYLRYHHDGILVGTETAIVDDPGLNCKYNNAIDQSPRPIVLNHSNRWDYRGSKIQKLYEKGHGKRPIIVVSELPIKKDSQVDYLVCRSRKWEDLFDKLYVEYGLKSIMVEGGANVINQLLTSSALIDSLIITIGPVFLGDGGVSVSPGESSSLKDVNWWKGTNDVVMCARLHK